MTREVEGTQTKNVSAFEASIVYRLAVELARTWVISHWLAKGSLPTDGMMWVYPRCADSAMDWGDDPDGPFRPLKGKRVQVTLSVQDFP